MPRPRAPCALCGAPERPADLRVRVPRGGAPWTLAHSKEARDQRIRRAAARLAGERVEACEPCALLLQPAREAIAAGQVARHRASTSRAFPAKSMSATSTRSSSSSTSTWRAGARVEFVVTSGDWMWQRGTVAQIVRAARDGTWYDVNLQPDWGRRRVVRAPAAVLQLVGAAAKPAKPRSTCTRSSPASTRWPETIRARLPPSHSYGFSRETDWKWMEWMLGRRLARRDGLLPTPPYGTMPDEDWRWVSCPTCSAAPHEECVDEDGRARWVGRERPHRARVSASRRPTWPCPWHKCGKMVRIRWNRYGDPLLGPHRTPRGQNGPRGVDGSATGIEVFTLQRRRRS